MNINQIDQPIKTPLNKGHGKSSVKTEPLDNKQGKVRAHQDEVNTGRSAHHKLRVGVQSLMSALQSNLTLSGSKSETMRFSFSSSQNIQLSEKQPIQLDKIAAEPLSFDFEAIANNVMEFVSNGILLAKADGADDDKLAEMLSQARSGIDQGFGMAREELDGLGMMTPELAEGITKSYDLLQSGLTDFEHDLFNKEQPLDSTENNTALAKSGVLNQQLNLLEQEEGTINIKTRDGDTVNIHFGSLMTLDQQTSNEQGIFSSEISFSQSQSFSLQIEGELDKKEQKAVASLLKDISKLADNFFSGNIEKAWQQANELGFDNKQIAQVSFDLEEVKQVAVTEHYGRVPQQYESPFATISPYLKDLNSAAEIANDLFQGDNLQQLMTSIADQHLAALDEGANSQQFAGFNQRLLDALS